MAAADHLVNRETYRYSAATSSRTALAESQALERNPTAGDAAAWAIVGPLVLARLGGGIVTSPNIVLGDL